MNNDTFVFNYYTSSHYVLRFLSFGLGTLLLLDIVFFKGVVCVFITVLLWPPLNSS